MEQSTPFRSAEGLRDYAQERLKKLGAATHYLNTAPGQKEAAHEQGNSGPPTGGSSGGTEAERAEFLADLHQVPKNVLL